MGEHRDWKGTKEAATRHCHTILHNPTSRTGYSSKMRQTQKIIGVIIILSTNARTGTTFVKRQLFRWKQKRASVGNCDKKGVASTRKWRLWEDCWGVTYAAITRGPARRTKLPRVAMVIFANKRISNNAIAMGVRCCVSRALFTCVVPPLAVFSQSFLFGWRTCALHTLVRCGILSYLNRVFNIGI